MGIFESIRKRGLQETLRRIEENVLWDTLDALPAESQPKIIEEPLPSGPTIPLVDRLFNRGEKRSGQAELWSAAKTLTPGTYGMRMNVGNHKEGTAHPHFFVIDIDVKGATFLFVDPEHHLNRTPRSPRQPVREGDIRPRVCNLTAVRMKDETTPPDFAVLRFRTNAIENPNDISFETQLGVARSLFATRASVPLPREFGGDLIFRMIVTPSTGAQMLIQSRYVKEKQARTFLREGKATSFLEGKRRAFAGLIEEFSAHLKRGEFTPKLNIERNRA